MQVWKTPLSFVNLSKELTMPRGSHPVHFAVQHEQPCLWWTVPQGVQDKDTFLLTIVGTGYDYRNDMIYVGTVLLQGGDLVLHAFVRKLG